MTVFVKVGGVWETVTELYVKRNGVWAQPKTAWFVNEFYTTQPQNLVSGGSFGITFSGGTWGAANAFWWNGVEADKPYDTDLFLDATYSVGTQLFYQSPPDFPLGAVGKISVPYTCNRMAFTMYGQGGAGAASTTNFAAGAGGSAASFVGNKTFIPGGIVVNEFDEFSLTITPENDTTTSGDGADGSSFTFSWPGNTITVGGGKGGLANGTNGAGGVVSGSGPVWATYSLNPLAARNGNPGVTNVYGINQGGSQLYYQGFSNPQSRDGGVLFGRFGAAGFTYAFDPESSAGGGGGYNSWGQKGGVGAFFVQFWRA